MIKVFNKNLLFPALISSVVLIVGFSLLVMVARSPYTHDNLNGVYNLNYDRTDQILVGSPIPYEGIQLAVTPASDPMELGRQLFYVKGCASCHGLDGRGGIIGPSILSATVAKLRSKTKVGPQGMPAYAPDALSDEDLAAIAAFLQSNK